MIMLDDKECRDNLTLSRRAVELMNESLAESCWSEIRDGLFAIFVFVTIVFFDHTGRPIELLAGLGCLYFLVSIIFRCFMLCWLKKQ